MAAAPADGPRGRAEGKNELALHLLGELDSAAQSITLTQWTPALLFEVKSRRLRLLRMKATRSETDKSRFSLRWTSFWPV
jgi:type VI secretion system protein VasJ